MKFKKKIAFIILLLLFVTGSKQISLINADSDIFQVTEIGVLDIQPKRNYVDFGSSYLWQIKFNKDIVDNSITPSNGKLKMFVQSEYGDFIAINGKTVNTWNSESFNSVMIHVSINTTLGQYLEMNTSSMIDGLLDSERDNYVTVLKGFPAADGSLLDKNVTFKLVKGSVLPFEKQDKAEDIKVEPTVTIDPSTIVFDVSAIGVIDQNPQKGLHDFGSTYLWQIDFTKDFYDPSKLRSGRKDHVHSELGKYIYVNGKTVEQWNLESFNSIMIHVATNPYFGQYLEISSTVMIDGLIDPGTENVVTVLKGFPCYSSEELKNSVSYSLNNGAAEMFKRLDKAVEPIENPVSEHANSENGSDNSFVIIEDKSTSETSSISEENFNEQSMSESSLSENNSEISDENGRSKNIIIAIVITLLVVVSGVAIFILRKKGILLKSSKK